MSGDEGVEIGLFVEVVSIIIPAAHVGARSGHALAFAKRLEQGIFVEADKQLVILIKLSTKGALEQLNARIAENGKRRRYGRGYRHSRPGCRQGAGGQKASCGNCGRPKELPARFRFHDDPPRRRSKPTEAMTGREKRPAGATSKRFLKNVCIALVGPGVKHKLLSFTRMSYPEGGFANIRDDCLQEVVPHVRPSFQHSPLFADQW